MVGVVARTVRGLPINSTNSHSQATGDSWKFSSRKKSPWHEENDQVEEKKAEIDRAKQLPGSGIIFL